MGNLLQTMGKWRFHQDQWGISMGFRVAEENFRA